MTFEKVNSKVVKVNLAQVGEVLARKGAMLYYTGQVGFVPEGPGGMPMPGMGGMAGGMAGMGGMGGHGGGLMQGMLGAAGPACTSRSSPCRATSSPRRPVGYSPTPRHCSRRSSRSRRPAAAGWAVVAAGCVECCAVRSPAR
jgi:hypothetical protein